MKNANRLLAAVCMTSLTANAGDAPTGELTDPIVILKKVDAAAKAVKAVKYDLSFEATGPLKRFLPTLHARIVVSGEEGHGSTQTFRCEVTAQRPDSEEVDKFTTGGDGEEFYLIDHNNKKAYVDMDPNVVGRTGGMVRQAMMREYLHPAPFTDELNGDKKELTGSKTIEGEDCYEIHVVYAGGRGEAVWYFSKKDFLPRARHDLRTAPGGEKGAMIKTVKNLVVDPKLDKDAFKFKLPTGYTQVDDFAP